MAKQRRKPTRPTANPADRPSRDPGSNPALNAPDPPIEEKQRQLEGAQPLGEQTAYIDQSDTDNLGDIRHVHIYEGEIEAGVNPDLPDDPDSLELLTELELRAEETDDAFVAAEEGMTYVPPIDPPTVPSDSLQDAEIASGMGVSALDEAYDADNPSSFLPADDDMSALVRDALRADSSTTQYADRVQIETQGGVVRLRGVVDDLDDSDNLVAVAQYVTGVTEVIDELRVRALE